MSRRTQWRSAVALLAGCAMVGGPIAASATASDTSMKLALSHAVPQLSRSQLRVSAALKHFSKTHSDAMLLSAVKVQNTDLRRLRTRLAGESASSPHGAQARTEMLKGLGLLLASNTDLVKAFRTRDHGGMVTTSELAAVKREGVQGNAAFKRGVRTLVHG